MEFVDWNKIDLDTKVEHLKSVFQFDSSGTAKAVFDLIDFYEKHTYSNKDGSCDEIICSTDFFGKCFKCGKQLFKKEN